MLVNQTNTTGIDDTRDNLPLQNFFISLKQNGYLVTPEQIADATRVISQYAGQVKNENELKYYLSPLFARNEEEQLQFEDIFQTHFKSGKAGKGEKKFNLSTHLKKHKWKYIVAAGVLIIGSIVVLSLITSSSKPFQVQIRITGNNDSTNNNFGDTAFRVRTDEPLYVKTEVGTVSTSYTGNKPVTLQTKYNWGDGDSLYTDTSHYYKKQGIYTLTAYADAFLDKKFKQSVTATATVLVCAEKNNIILSSDKPSDSARVGEKIKIRANITGREPDSTRWDLGENLRYGKELDTSFAEEGRYTIACIAIYDSLNGPCTIRDEISIDVYDPAKPKIDFSVVQADNATPIVMKSKVKPGWFYGGGSLCLLSFILTVVLSVRSNRNRKIEKKNVENTDQKFNELLHSFSGKKTPAELPFQNKNYLPVPEPGIYEAATQMRRRINIEASFLQVQKTIEKSIDSNGFFQPVYVPRLQQSEYLVLIDASHNNNQQVKLFDYLIEILRKQNVFIEKYYYRYEPKLCFNALEPGGVSLEKLSEKYDKHILLIFGNAYQLLYQYYPVFDNEYLHLLNRWQNKAVITPVSFLDWDSKETRALLPQIPVVPVDTEGQLALMEILFTQEFDIVAALKQYEKTFYKVAPVDFENIQELQTYCNNAAWAKITEDEKETNILFQWIAALAIYPKIKWETTLAIGKAILDRYGKGEALNFTNLLRIARIKWMKDGQFPDYTRLDLLKSLTVNNEIAARETILALLKEIPESEMNPQHFAYEEKEIQRITNEFILYAYNPLKYARYKESKDVFEKLWKEKKITDAPSKVYLKNEGAEWDTLINKVPDGEGRLVTKNVPIDKYFEPDEKTIDKENKQNLFWVKAASLLFLLSIIGLIFLTVIHFSNTSKFPALTYQPAIQKDIRFNLINNSSVSSDRINLSTSDFTTTGNWGNSVSVPVLIAKGSTESIDLVADSLNNTSLELEIKYDTYNVVVTENNNRKDAITLLLSSECSGSRQTYTTIIRDVDKSIPIKDSIIPGYANSAANTVRCLNKMAVGNNVSSKIVNDLLASFKKSGITLEVDTYPSFTVNSNEVVLYYNEKPVVSKPMLYVQYNDSGTLRKARQLVSCINQGVFSVLGMWYVAPNRYLTRSEIRYYNQSFTDSIKLLQQCLRSIYPGKTFYPIKLNKTNPKAVAEIWIYDSTVLPLRTGGPDYVFRSMKEALAADPNLVYKLDLSNQRYDYFEIYKFPNLKEINIRNTGASAKEIEALEDYMTKKGGKVISDPSLTRGFKVFFDNYNSKGRLGVFVQSSNGVQFAICVVPESVKDNNVYPDVTGKRGAIGVIYSRSKMMPLIALVRIKGFRGENVFTGSPSRQTSGTIQGVKNAELNENVNLFDPWNVGRGGDPIPIEGKITQLNYSGNIYTEPGKNVSFTNAFTADISTAEGLSGSLLTSSTGYALGILIAGDGKQTIYIPIQKILDEFNVRIVYPAAAAAK